MKVLRFFKPGHDLAKLQDEIFAAVPSLRPVSNTMGRIDPAGQIALDPVIYTHGYENEVCLTVPDDTDKTELELVISAHVG